MIKQINIDRTRDEILRISVLHDKRDENRFVESFEELTTEEMDFFKENAKNVWWFGNGGGIDKYIINENTNYCVMC